MPSFGGFSPYKKVAAKTAAYQVRPEDIDTIFTTEGATAAVTFTLPPVTGLVAGWHCRFFSGADVGMTVASSGSNDNLIAFNDIAADSIAYSTSSEIIGSGCEVVWSGAKWLVHQYTAASHRASVTVA